MKLFAARASSTKAADASASDLVPLADHPRYRREKDALDAVLARSAETNVRRKRALQRLKTAGTVPTRPVAERAADLLRGGKVTGADPVSEIRACDEEDVILDHAIRAQRERIEEVSGRLSYEASLQVAGAHRAALEALAAGMQAIHDALAADFEIIAALRSAGYRPSEVVLAAPVHPAVQVMAVEAAPFRKWLESKNT
jgi:hypothetical protein